MEITICEALKELKTLDKRINDTIQKASFTTIKTGGKLPAQHRTEEEFKASAASSLKSIKDLIERRNSIKSAIVESNAATKVTIGGIPYTVAAAIERKSSVVYEQTLVRALGVQVLRTIREVEVINDQVKRNLDGHISTMLGKDAKDKGGQEVEDMTAAYLKRNEGTIVDPCNAKAEIDALEAKIDAFLANVDTQLSISNATTKIVVG